MVQAACTYWTLTSVTQVTSSHGRWVLIGAIKAHTVMTLLVFYVIPITPKVQFSSKIFEEHRPFEVVHCFLNDTDCMQPKQLYILLQRVEQIGMHTISGERIIALDMLQIQDQT